MLADFDNGRRQLIDFLSYSHVFHLGEGKVQRNDLKTILSRLLSDEVELEIDNDVQLPVSVIIVYRSTFEAKSMNFRNLYSLFGALTSSVIECEFCQQKGNKLNRLVISLSLSQSSVYIYLQSFSSYFSLSVISLYIPSVILLLFHTWYRIETHISTKMAEKYL